jgi:hypothetical protein
MASCQSAREHLSGRPIAELDQGQEPQASRDGQGYGGVLMTGSKVGIYVDTSKSVGHPDHLQVFAG